MAEQATRQPEEQFASLAVQGHTVRLGMWVFLASEAMLFAGLFGLYFAYRSLHYDAFTAAIDENNQLLGSVNTLILITSSFTVAWAIHKMRAGVTRTAVRMLVVTVALGVVFLAVKSYEYLEHVHHGILPGRYYAFEELPERGSMVFFTLYYLTTGLHFLHVIVGIGVVGAMALLVHRARIRPDYDVPLELGGLYWHLVDLIWIFVWPFMYLMS
jgi:cytochrome c oxidase subunit III